MGPGCWLSPCSPPAPGAPAPTALTSLGGCRGSHTPSTLRRREHETGVRRRQDCRSPSRAQAGRSGPHG